MKKIVNIKITIETEVTTKQDLFDLLNDMVFPHQDVLDWEQIAEEE